MKFFQATFLAAGASALLIVASNSDERRDADIRLRFLITQVPAQTIDGIWSEASSLSLRYPSGSRVVLVEPGEGGEGVIRVLSEGLDAAGAFPLFAA